MRARNERGEADELVGVCALCAVRCALFPTWALGAGSPGREAHREEEPRGEAGVDGPAGASYWRGIGIGIGQRGVCIHIA